jgi:hypothetical protein
LSLFQSLCFLSLLGPFSPSHVQKSLDPNPRGLRPTKPYVQEGQANLGRPMSIKLRVQKSWTKAWKGKHSSAYPRKP